MRIDSHQHFWKSKPPHQVWMTDEMAVLRRDYLPEELKPQLEAIQFDGTIAVQARQTNRLLIISLLGMGGAAVLLSVIFSKRLITPVEQLTRAVTDIAEGNLTSRVTASDIDEVSRLSEAFNKMAHALEIQESLRKRMTSNIAHELRTRVSAIRGELEGMMDGLITIDQEHIQSLHAEIGRFKAIIEGLEELSRAEASSLSLEKQLISLDSFLRNILERYRKMFSDKGVDLALDCEEAITLHADPDRLSQVIINLLVNALRAFNIHLDEVDAIELQLSQDAVDRRHGKLDFARHGRFLLRTLCHDEGIQRGVVVNEELQHLFPMPEDLRIDDHPALSDLLGEFSRATAAVLQTLPTP